MSHMPLPDAHPQAARLRSGTAARLAGLPVATLRVWERRYGVVAAPKTAGGQRLYSAHDVQRLRLLRQLSERGHAIGTIAMLALDALEAWAASGPGDSPAGPAGPAEPQRVVVVGRSAALRLQAAGSAPPQAVFDELAQAEAAAAGAPAADTLLVQLPSLQPAVAERVLALRAALHAPVLAVVYAYGAEALAETLRAAGATVRREPVTGHELARLTAPRRAGTAAAPAAAVDRGGRVEPRRFTDEALVELTEWPSSVACECPRHVAELVMQLSAFERYSADCGARSPADADLHRQLSGLAGAARTQFELALERLVAEESPPPGERPVKGGPVRLLR